MTQCGRRGGREEEGWGWRRKEVGMVPQGGTEDNLLVVGFEPESDPVPTWVFFPESVFVLVLVLGAVLAFLLPLPAANPPTDPKANFVWPPVPGANNATFCFFATGCESFWGVFVSFFSPLAGGSVLAGRGFLVGDSIWIDEDEDSVCTGAGRFRVDVGGFGSVSSASGCGFLGVDGEDKGEDIILRVIRRWIR